LGCGRRLRCEVAATAVVIVEAWNSWDQLGLLRQIGALPAPTGHDRFLTEDASASAPVS
jgi:hypothetical protein